MSNHLQVADLSIQRGDRLLLSHLHSHWQSGDFVQLEGHNGIGKTSFLRTLAGLAQPQSGQILWNGNIIQQERENYALSLLYLGHQSGVKGELTAWENLRFYQRVTPSLQGDQILWEVLDKVGLFGREDLPANVLSAGQQKRIALARLWLSQAPLWLLDEPFNAIDKQGVANLTALFEAHCEQGGIVILTSHQAVQSSTLQLFPLSRFKVEEGER